MSTKSKDASTEEVYAAPIPDAVAQHIAAARIVASSGGGSNPQAMVNAHNLAEKKKHILKACYDATGRTIPAAAVNLAIDAERKIRHSRVLAKNIDRATGGHARAEGTDTHHIVARLDRRAEVSRMYLFAWGIGINDADNGVYLPRCGRTIIAAMPGACPHRHLHTDHYYFNVTEQLRGVRDSPTPVARAVLRLIKSDLIAGIFSY